MQFNEGLHKLKHTKKIIMKTLKEFRIWLPTEFGIGFFLIKARNFKDAFLRLGKKDKIKNGWIEDEDGETQTFNFILGLEE